MESYEYEVMAAVEGDHWWYRGMRALSAAWLDPHFHDRNDLRILDAGCGTGGNAEFLQRYGMVVGLDLAPLALELGRRRIPGRLARSSVVALPFVSESFDLVTSFDVLYHRDVIDEGSALCETRRVLRPGGHLLIRLPAYKWLSSAHDRSVHGRQRYTAGEMRAMLERAGLRIVRLSYINSLLLPIPLLQRLLQRIVAAGDDQRSDLELPHRIVNTALQSALYLEAAWLRDGGRFPAGLSILALAQKS